VAAVVEPTPAEATWDERIAPLTGGMAPDDLPPFAGSVRLRPDGRPRGAFRDELRRLPDVRNALAVVSVLTQPVVITWAVVTVDHWLAWAAGMVLMGSVFARFLALNHEAAHRLLFSNRRLNDLVGTNLLGWLAFGDGSHAYRRAHASHHRDEFGPKEPDLALYARYPIGRASMRRKLTRDAVGVSGWKNLRPPLERLLRQGRRRLGLRFLTGMAFTFTLFALAGHPWAWVLLWFVPWMTVWRVINRLRAIAEHAGMTRSDDRRRTTHDVRQSLPARVLMVPYNIGLHLAHHVDSGIPWRNLPAFHRALVEDGYAVPRITHRSYVRLWRDLAAG